MILVVGLAGAAVLAGAALAQAPAACGPRAAVLRALVDNYGEAPVAMGLTADGRLVEILATPDGATWTALLSEAGGEACVVAVGRHWQPAAPRRHGEPS
jgi:hypothetical protein